MSRFACATLVRRLFKKQLLFCLLTLIAFLAHAQALTPPVQNGLNWLKSVAPSVSAENASIAIAFQARQEAAVTLNALGAPVPDALVDRTVTQDGAESLSRQISVLALGSRNYTNSLNSLIAYQNTDGGLSDTQAGLSSALPTSYALLTLNQINAAQSVRSTAASFLSKQVLSNGAIRLSFDAGRTQVEANAVAMRALSAFQNNGESLNAINALSQWLLSQQAPDGSWSQDNVLTAHAILGLLTAPASSVTKIRSAQAWLAQQQRQDGSWGGDEYVTALALRAVSAQVTDPPPVDTALLGRVLDQSSNQPLQNAQIHLVGTDEHMVYSAADGSFRVTNLAGGDYNVSFSLSGYAEKVVSVHVANGTTVDLGNLLLAKPLTTYGIVSGQVKDGDTGLPLNNAVITVSDGSLTRTQQTDGAGFYRMSDLVPGNYAVKAEYSGYKTVSGAFQAKAGDMIVFSPQLYSTNSPITLTTARLSGRTLSDADGSILPGTQILAGANLLGQSAADGTFSFDLAPDTDTVIYRKSGYQDVKQILVLTAGAIVSVGDVRLPIRQTPLTLLQGVVTDGNTGFALIGAAIKIQSATTQQSAVTDAQGRYSMTVPEAGACTLTVSFDRYKTVTLNATIVDGVANQFSPQLYPASGSGSLVTRIIGKTVSDAQGTPLGNVLVYNGTSLLGQSAANGAFGIDLPPNAYTLTFRTPGYVDSVYSFVLSEGTTGNMGNIQLALVKTQSTLTGLIVDSQTQAPISGAQVTLLGGASAMSDSQGHYSLSILGSGSSQLSVSAPGYLAQTYVITLDAAADASKDFSLKKASSSNSKLALLSVTTDKSVYSADEEVSIKLSAANSGQENRVTEAQINIKSQGNLVNYQDAITFDKLNPTNQITIAGGGVSFAGGTWMTGFAQPGQYEVVVSLIERPSQDSGGWSLIDQRTVTFTILPMVNVRSVTLTPSPRNYNLNAQADVQLNAKISNSSNLDTTLVMNYAIKSPSNVVIKTGQATVPLQASEAIKSVVLDTPNLTFAESGEYPISLSLVSGAEDVALIAKPISVAPGTRIEVSHGMTPTTVAPDGAQELSITIELKGIEQK